MLFYGSFKKFGEFILTGNYKIMYIYHAKTLISKILSEFTDSNIPFENMIYLNPGWDYGEIHGKTIKLLDKQNPVDEFFSRIPTTDYKNVRNELVIKWVTPCNIKYGMVTLTNTKFPFTISGGSISRIISYDLIHYKNKYIDNKKNYLSLIYD